MTLDRLFASEPFDLVLENPIPAALIGEVEKASAYFSRDLVKLRAAGDGASVAITARPGADLTVLRSKVERAIAAMVAAARDMPVKVHYRRSNGRGLQTGVNQELIRRGWVFEHGQGQASLSGPALKLLHALDLRFADIYRKQFGAIDRMYPAMVSPALLQRVGYFSSHPDAASFVCHMVEDFDELERFRIANAEGLAAPEADALAPPHHCLNPAACFPSYELLQDRKLDAESLVLSWMGRVFRYESRNMSGLDRLWEFNVRELVFIGSERYIVDARARSAALVQELAEEWDLDCRLESASDAFFPTVYGQQSFWQRVKDVKYEIRLAVEPGAKGEPRDLAAGSINLHGPFFGERFNIRLPNDEIRLHRLRGHGPRTLGAGAVLAAWFRSQGLAGVLARGFRIMRTPPTLLN